MSDVLFQLDLLLFRAINHGMSNPVFDALMPVVTSFRWWAPVFAVGMAWLLIRGQRRGRWCAAFMVLVIAFADPLTNRVVKPIVQRERPCRQLTEVLLRIPCADGPSFPSSHAVNMAAVAVVLVWFYRRGWWAWVLAAGMVGFSRVYVGVHYPSDVLCGWVLGGTIGAATVGTVRWWIERRSATSGWKRRLRWW